MTIKDRVKLRIEDEAVSSAIVDDICQTVQDRLIIRLGTRELPECFESIAVDASVKAVRRLHYEGIQSEGAANISTSFVSDILAEYEAEISRYREDHSAELGGKVIRFY